MDPTSSSPSIHEKYCQLLEAARTKEAEREREFIAIIGALEEENASLANQVDLVRDQYDEAVSQRDEAVSSKELLQSQIDALTQLHERSQSEMQLLVSSLQLREATFDRDISATAAQLAKFEGECQLLSSLVAELRETNESEAQKHSEYVQAQAEQAALIRNENEALRTQCSMLQNAVQSLTLDVGKLRNEKSTAEDCVATLRGELALAEQREAQCQIARQLALTEAERLADQNAALNDELKLARECISANQLIHEQLLSERTAVLARLEALSLCCEAQTAEMAALRSEKGFEAAAAAERESDLKSRYHVAVFEAGLIQIAREETDIRSRLREHEDETSRILTTFSMELRKQLLDVEKLSAYVAAAHGNEEGNERLQIVALERVAYEGLSHRIHVATLLDVEEPQQRAGISAAGHSFFTKATSDFYDVVREEVLLRLWSGCLRKLEVVVVDEDNEWLELMSLWRLALADISVTTAQYQDAFWTGCLDEAQHAVRSLVAGDDNEKILQQVCSSVDLPLICEELCRRSTTSIWDWSRHTSSVLFWQQRIAAPLQDALESRITLMALCDAMTAVGHELQPSTAAAAAESFYGGGE